MKQHTNKFHECGCYSINSQGKKVYLKTNVRYHKQHNPMLMIDQRKLDKSNQEYMKEFNLIYGHSN